MTSMDLHWIEKYKSGGTRGEKNIIQFILSSPIFFLKILYTIVVHKNYDINHILVGINKFVSIQNLNVNACTSPPCVLKSGLR